MTGHRFDEINKALCFTLSPPPTYRDKFFQVRELLEAFNARMRHIFIPRWISCLDESMSIWTNRWTCPGWIFCPRKPHPYGNEYHTICDGQSGIMYAVEIVEGKDRPREIGKPEFHAEGNTASLLLCLTRNLFGTGKLVVLDSRFCVLQAITALKKFGVYASALIKKCRYWPKHIDGPGIQKYMADKDIGHQARLPGELDGVGFDIFALKEPEYTMM